MRLIPGILATLASVALCLQIRSSYMRHLDTGDHAGSSLGTFFLASWYLPLAGIALLVGAILLPLHRRNEVRPSNWVLVILLMACAAFFLFYGLAIEVPGWWPGSRSERDFTLHAFAATTLAFSVNVLACALAARMAIPSAAAGRWLSGLLLVTTGTVVVQVVAFVRQFIQFHFLLIYLPFVIGPSLVWVATLLRGAWVLSRGRSTAPLLR